MLFFISRSAHFIGLRPDLHLYRVSSVLYLLRLASRALASTATRQLVRSLREALESRSFKNGAVAVFRDVDFNLLSFEEQVAVDVTTDVMIGPHGAGLMHNIFMPDRATLIELHIDGSGANQHFHNLARWQGRTYQSKHVQNPLPVRDIVDTVIKAVEAIDINSY